MIIEELRAIKAFGSAIESNLTLEDIKQKEQELGTSLPEALKEFYLTFDKNDPIFSAKNKFIPLHELKATERHLIGTKNVEVITFYIYGIWGVGFIKGVNSEENNDPYSYTYYSEPKNQKQQQSSICKSSYRLSSSILGWVSSQQLFSQNSVGKIKPESLKYNNQDVILKLFNILPVGLAENNIGRACSTKDSNLYAFIDFGSQCVFVSASSPNLVERFMESCHIEFEWVKLNGEFVRKTEEKHKSIKRRPLENIEPAIQTLNHFIRIVRLESQIQDMINTEQRIKAAIPEPLKMIYSSVLPQFLRSPDYFVPVEELKNEDGIIRFLSTAQGIFNYAFAHLSPIVYQSEMDGTWREYGMIDGFIVTKLFWNIMNSEELGVVLTELAGCSKHALSARGSLGNALVPCFQNLTKNYTQQLYHSSKNDIIAIYDTQLKTLYAASVGEKPLQALEKDTNIEFSWLT